MIQIIRLVVRLFNLRYMDSISRFYSIFIGDYWIIPCKNSSIHFRGEFIDFLWME